MAVTINNGFISIMISLIALSFQLLIHLTERIKQVPFTMAEEKS